VGGRNALRSKTEHAPGPNVSREPQKLKHRPRELRLVLQFRLQVHA